MSRSSIPARFSAARTRSIRVAFSAIAPVAVDERVTTPAEIMARSGTRLTVPVALTSSRVPATGRAKPAGSWALAGAAERAAALISSAIMIRFISHSPDARHRAASWPRRDGLNMNVSLSASAEDQSVDEQDEEGADDRGDEAGRFALLI